MSLQNSYSGDMFEFHSYLASTLAELTLIFIFIILDDLVLTYHRNIYERGNLT